MNEKKRKEGKSKERTNYVSSLFLFFLCFVLLHSAAVFFSLSNVSKGGLKVRVCISFGRRHGNWGKVGRNGVLFGWEKKKKKKRNSFLLYFLIETRGATAATPLYPPQSSNREDKTTGKQNTNVSQHP